MLYDSLKIFHILIAALLLTSVVYGCRLWMTTGKMQHLQTQTGTVSMPLAILQLLTGFSLISLKQEGLSTWWIGGVVTAFVVMVITWLGFICCKRAQRSLLCVAGLALLSMLFLMASRS